MKNRNFYNSKGIISKVGGHKGDGTCKNKNGRSYLKLKCQSRLFLKVPDRATGLWIFRFQKFRFSELPVSELSGFGKFRSLGLSFFKMNLPHVSCLHSRLSFESSSGHPSSPILPKIQVLTLTDSDTPHVLEHGDQLFQEAQRAHGNPPHGWVSTFSPFGHESDPILAPLHWRFRIF